MVHPGGGGGGGGGGVGPPPGRDPTSTLSSGTGSLPRPHPLYALGSMSFPPPTSRSMRKGFVEVGLIHILNSLFFLRFQHKDVFPASVHAGASGKSITSVAGQQIGPVKHVSNPHLTRVIHLT